MDIQVGEDKKTRQISKKEPHIFNLNEEEFGILKVKLRFKGHYEEKPLTIDFNLAECQNQLYRVSYNPFEHVWESVVPLY